MANQQLLDFIKQQMQPGISREQIKSSLMANGWQAQDIEEGFNSLNLPASPQQYSATSANSPAKVWKILAGVLVGVAILGGGAYFASKTFLKSEAPPKISNEVTNKLPTEIVAPTEQPAQQTKPQNLEIVFADKLSSCTKYKTTFKHPFTGETLEKEILGIVSGKCDYVEQMPNGGKMECKYSESERMAVA